MCVRERKREKERERECVCKEKRIVDLVVNSETLIDIRVDIQHDMFCLR